MPCRRRSGWVPVLWFIPRLWFITFLSFHSVAYCLISIDGPLDCSQVKTNSPTMADHGIAEQGLPDYDKYPSNTAEKVSSNEQRKGSIVNPEVLSGQLYDVRFESTQRGLKSRHAQMIALGWSSS